MNDAQLADLTRLLVDHPEVELAILYGSVAQGTETPVSDLDLAVLGAHPLSAEASMDLIGDLASLTGRPVDLVDLRTTHGTLLREILRTGIRIVETDDALFPSLLSRYLIDEADFGPIRDRILAERRHTWIHE